MFSTEIVNGVYRAIELVKYSNGKIVKRILNPKTLVPESIEVICKGR
jgi:hypothetical protein